MTEQQSKLVAAGGFEPPTSIPDSAPDTSNSVLEDQQLSLALKERVLDEYEDDPWLARARRAARGLLVNQGRDSISIDDVLEVVGPPPRQNLPGAVFRKGFERVGYTTTKKLHGHGNPIGMWRLA